MHGFRIAWRALAVAGMISGCSAPDPSVPSGNAAPVAAADWPQWRGPNRDGVSHDPRPLRLAADPPVRWSVPVGFGVASPVVAGGRVVAMGHVKEQGRNRGTDTVWCLDAETGAVVWRQDYEAMSLRTTDIVVLGPRATPAVAGGAVYVMSLDGRIACLDAATGALRWTRRALEELEAGTLPPYGFASAPLVTGGLVVVDLCRVCVGLDASTGDLKWKAAGGGNWNGSAPVPFVMDGVPCIVYGEQPVRCVEAATGRERWAYDIVGCATPTPVIIGDQIFLSPFHAKSCVMLRVAGGTPAVLWKNEEAQGLCSTAVAWRGHLYAPHREDTSMRGENGRKMAVKCVEIATWAVRWTKSGLKWPNVVVAGGRLIVMTLEGELVVAEASPEAWKEIARATILKAPVWSPPALAAGRLYARNVQGDLVCVDLRCD
jgi:outer membrane protein assembly factor BamB